MSALACVAHWLTRGQWEQDRRDAEQETIEAQQRIVEVERRKSTVEKLRRVIVEDRRQNHYAADIEAALKEKR